MRRNEFSSLDFDEIERIASRCDVGYLGMVDPDGYPRVVPLNFVLNDRCIYFHGALEGEKFDALSANPKVTFSVVEPYSFIPSYWIAKEFACPATVFYKSVYFRGQGSLIHDPSEKAAVFQALLEKHQTEGHYRPISAKDPLYEKPLQQVSVFKIEPAHVDAKFKFGQNFSAQKRLELIKKLEERGTLIDKRTAAEVKKTLRPEPQK